MFSYILLIELHGVVKVINWVSRVVTSATRTDERRAVISSLLRVALACKNMGNFMGATEILSGLRQVYCKIFLLLRILK